LKKKKSCFDINLKAKKLNVLMNKEKKEKIGKEGGEEEKKEIKWPRASGSHL
jgi:hypothetical protein